MDVGGGLKAGGRLTGNVGVGILSGGIRRVSDGFTVSWGGGGGWEVGGGGGGGWEMGGAVRAAGCTGVRARAWVTGAGAGAVVGGVDGTVEEVVSMVVDSSVGGAIIADILTPGFECC